MTDLNKILAENQKEILKLTTPPVKKTSNQHDLCDSDSGSKTTFITPTRTQI